MNNDIELDNDSAETQNPKISLRLQHAAAKGRGTGYNQQSRFLATQSFAVDDGWQHASASVEQSQEHQGKYLKQQELDARGGHNPENSTEEVRFIAATQSPGTQFFADRTKRLITTNSSPDISFNQSINAYKGCEHGCVYCFARPTHAYLDLSPGLDFESKIFYKTNVRECLLRELGAVGYQCSPIAMGTNTDPYQPGEKNYRITRQILELLSELNHPVSIVTKSALIKRDLDLLSSMAQRGLVSINISVTTLDNGLKTKLEPRTAGPRARLRIIEALRAADIPVGALVAPIIPFINDAELEEIVSRVADSGASSVGYILLRLPHEVKPLFERWLQEHYPLKAERVMAAIRSTRGGRAYNAQWHQRMVGSGAMAELIKQRFKKIQRNVGLADVRLPALRTDLFKRENIGLIAEEPPPQGGQLRLF